MSGISNTYFTKLELSGNFNADTYVFPQSVFTELQLMPQLEKVLPDGRIILNLEDDSKKENIPLVSMSLFGRKYGDDGPAPEQWCPHIQSRATTVTVRTIIYLIGIRFIMACSCNVIRDLLLKY